MKIFYAPNTVAIASLILLEELGLDYEPMELSFADAEQTSPAYMAINPKGRVPAVVVDDTILTETGAILEYIAQQAPGAGMMPSDPMEAAQMRSVMYYVASTMHVNHAHKMRGHRWANLDSSHKDMTAKVPQTMTESATFVEHNALRAPFVMGDQITLADPYLFIACNWAKNDGADLSELPKVRAFLATMEARASVKLIRERGWLTV